MGAATQLMRALLLCLLAAVGSACATAHRPLEATELAEARALPPIDAEPIGPPEADPSPAPVARPGQPIDAEALREKLVVFVADSQAERSSAGASVPMPLAQQARWRALGVEVDRYLLNPPTASQVEEVGVARSVLQAVLDQDQYAYASIPHDVLSLAGERLARLQERVAALEATGRAAPRAAFAWPLSTVRVTSRFGRRFHPIARRYKLHSGVDLAADRNELVAAAGSGTVVRAGWSTGYGYEVEIEHGKGLVTRYSHLTQTLVLEGTQVATGDPLGLAGATGTATGVHLHFELWKDGVARDPLKDFKRLVGAPGPAIVLLDRAHRRPAARKKAKVPEGPGA